jgi:hypothetical protein
MQVRDAKVLLTALSLHDRRNALVNVWSTRERSFGHIVSRLNLSKSGEKRRKSFYLQRLVG